MVSYAESAMELRNWLNFVAYALVVSNIFVAVAQLQLLPQHEVETLEAIFVKLNFKHGKISRSFCSSSEAQNVTETIPIKILINITCSCSGTVCHVTNIKMKTKNLFGALPTEFANLSQLTEIELTRNYINGGIPPAFIKLPLTILSLSENPIGGLIPETIGDIGTLEELVLECANLSGLLPPNLGSLNGLRRLVLSSNNFTGTIPDTFGKLKNLTEFRIQGSGLHGKIPSLIGNWTKITILDMQGTSMEGPIPDSLSQLKDLEELAISDLTGSATTTKFPNLRDMKNLEKLVLRNCNIAAPIPDYIGELQYLMLLDLSFNLLAGRIPALLPTGKLKNMFLNGNSLYGTLPDWVSSSNFYLDISYNNFIVTSSITCSQPKLNAVAITSSIQKNSKLEWCLKKDLPCSTKPKYSSNEGQASFYYAPSEKWAYSSTGVSMYEDSPAYRAQNTFSLNITGPNYYQTARVAPSSLKYYGLCLLKGSYKVRLHFAEIMFSNDQTFSSLGNRIFDVSIQGKPVLENFNIAEEAGGVGKAIDKEFHADVNGSTLEIHLYWSGKGSTSVPQEGVHGPLISAISVTMVNPPTSGLSLGVIIGIVACSCVFLVFVLFVLRMKGYLGGKDPEDTAATRHIFEHNMADENQEEDLQLRLFDLAAITNATDNFSINNMLGEGGFGPVYKGVLEGGQEIAVKRLSSHSTQGLEEFKNEVICIAKLQHWNLVKLLGYCVEREEKMLIYEYMSNKSLDLFIFDETRTTLLNWPQRFNIINGISRGILYLHQDSRVIIIHRDLKASNVLLDIDMNPKIADFGMARSFGRNVMEAQTGRVVGTFGYMSPEYQVDGIFSVRSDVFSFGVLVLEIVSGKKNRGFYHPDHNHNLLGHAWMLYNEGRSLELIDATAIDDNSRYLSEMMRSIHVALLCVQRYPEDRPSMSSVVLMLSSDVELPQPKEPGFFTERNPVEVESSTSRDACSPNGVTITLLDAR